MSGVRIAVETARAACAAALRRLGAGMDVAERVAEDLVCAELEGYPSHGLMRMRDYAEAIARGELDPTARPAVEAMAAGCARVEGRRAFGVLCADAVRTTLEGLLEAHAVCAVSLVDAAHLGRLSHVAAPLAERGHVVVGFANFLGAGQRVAPPGRTEPRLCTNPIVLAAPRGGGPPLVADVSTSAVSEGRVRMALLAGEPIPDGWLLDGDGRWSHDAAALYETPPGALLASLGGPEAAHKGFALALACEVLAGIVTGAGHARPGAAPSGNGGLFLGLRGGSLGPSGADVGDGVASLLDYCATSPPLSGSAPLRVPGDTRGRADAAIVVLDRVWEELHELGAA